DAVPADAASTVAIDAAGRPVDTRLTAAAAVHVRFVAVEQAVEAGGGQANPADALLAHTVGGGVAASAVLAGRAHAAAVHVRLAAVLDPVVAGRHPADAVHTSVLAVVVAAAGLPFGTGIAGAAAVHVRFRAVLDPVVAPREGNRSAVASGSVLPRTLAGFAADQGHGPSEDDEEAQQPELPKSSHPFLLAVADGIH